MEEIIYTNNSNIELPPYSNEVRNIIDFFTSIEDDSRYDSARISFSINIFCHVLKLLKKDFEISDFQRILLDNLTHTKKAVSFQNVFIDMLSPCCTDESSENINEQTQNHYSAMFSNIEDKDFFQIAPNNLKRLFDLNDLKIDAIESKIALDAGCGSGRYSYGLKQLGFSRVIGLDFSKKNIDFAEKKVHSRNIKDIDFVLGDVINLPFDNERFDFVFSNGVLHHVDLNYNLTLSEINRILKPGGQVYLYVMERPGGILLETIDVIRHVLRNVPESTTLNYMKYLGFRGYTIYNVLDHVYVPINKRVTRNEIEDCIKSAGFIKIKRFKRGLPNYNIELLRTKPNDCENIWKYGIGEHIYCFQKVS